MLWEGQAYDEDIERVGSRRVCDSKGRLTIRQKIDNTFSSVAQGNWRESSLVIKGGGKEQLNAQV
jgi:hypothetical protein